MSTPLSSTLRFKGYRLENVYLRTTAAQRAEAVAFWIAHGALRNRAAGERRSRELVYLVRRADGDLAGMATVRLKRGAEGADWYLFRMFLAAGDRVPYLMRVVTNATRDFLRRFEHPRTRPRGMLFVTENRKLMRPGIKRYLTRHGYIHRGRTPRGLDLWLAPFGAERTL